MERINFTLRRRALLTTKYLVIGFTALTVAAVIFKLLLALQLPEWGLDERRYLEDAWWIWTGSKNLFWYQQQLYSLLISPIFFFGDSYFAALKVANIILLVCGLGFFYLCVRSVAERVQSVIATFLVASLGQHVIAGHAMTESLMFPVYWCALWLLPQFIAESAEKPFRIPLAAGVCSTLLLCSSIKFGAILLVWLACYFLIVSYRPLKNWLPRFAIAFGSCIITFAIAKMLSRPSWDIYGSYENASLLVKVFLTEIGKHPRNVVDMVASHIGSVLFPFALSIGVTAVAFFRSIKRDDRTAIYLLGFGLAGLVAAAAQGVFFTICIEGHVVAGIAQARYYSFALPVFLIGLFYLPGELTKTQRAALSIFILLIAAAAWYTSYSGLSQAYPWPSIENAELWQRIYPKTHLFIFRLSILIAIAVLFAPLRAVRAIFVVLFAINGICASLGATVSMGGFAPRRMPDCAFLKQLYTKPGDKVAIGGADYAAVEATAIYPPFGNFVFHRPPANKKVEAVTSVAQARELPELRGFRYLLLDGAKIDGARIIGSCSLIDLKS